MPSSSDPFNYMNDNPDHSPSGGAPPAESGGQPVPPSAPSASGPDPSGAILQKLKTGLAKLEPALARTKESYRNLSAINQGRLQGGGAALAVALVWAIAARDGGSRDGASQTQTPRLTGVPGKQMAEVQRLIEEASRQQKQAEKTGDSPAVTAGAANRPQTPVELPPRQDYSPAKLVKWLPAKDSIALPDQGELTRFRHHGGSFDTDGDTVMAGRSILRWGPADLKLEDQLSIVDEKFDQNSGWDSSMVCRISGDTAIITSPQLRNQSGAVFVFERKGGAWSQVARLVAPDGRPGAMLGSSAEIDGDWIVAGAPQHPMTDQHGSERRVGAVYVWRRTEGQWKFSCPIQFTSLEGYGQKAGEQVSVSGGRIAISIQANGENGILTGRVDDKDVWHDEFVIRGALHGIGDGEFAMDGDLMAVRARNPSQEAGQYRGAEQVFLFSAEKTEKGTEWRRTASIVAPDYHELDNKLKGFGEGLSLRSGVLAVQQGRTSRLFTRRKDGRWGPVEAALSAPEATVVRLVPHSGELAMACIQAGGSLIISTCAANEKTSPPAATAPLSRAPVSFLVKAEDGLTRQSGRKDPFEGEAYELNPKTGKPVLLEHYRAGKLHGESRTFQGERMIRLATYADGELKEEKKEETPQSAGTGPDRSPSPGDRLFSSRLQLEQQTYLLEVQRQQALRDAQTYQTMAEQEARYQAQREMRRYREQMSGYLGALGIQQ